MASIYVVAVLRVAVFSHEHSRFSKSMRRTGTQRTSCGTPNSQLPRTLDVDVGRTPTSKNEERSTINDQRSTIDASHVCC